jgi:hypothetical protein
MRLRAGIGLLCVGLAGCQHLPEGVKIDLPNRTVEVGPCRCRLPAPGEANPVAAAPGGEAVPAAAPDEAAGGDEPR